MAYIPNSDKDRQEMLHVIGVESFDELIDNLPREFVLRKDLNVPSAMPENELIHHFLELAGKNKTTICFAGGGSYDHYVPAAIAHILQRSEFYTAYTPYQPEVSQGTLQAIYEYQTLISRILKMDVVNASMYDGGTALAEAVLMAHGINGKKRVVVPFYLNPRYLSIIRTYISDTSIELITAPAKEGQTDLAELEKLITDETSAVVIQQPNFIGILEDAPAISELVHRKNALLIASVDPTSLSVLKAPGDYNADIVVAEGQPFGIPVNFGGPYLGIFAAKKEFIRRMPGRIIGMTEDLEGKRGFVMVLQTREQHIRREKATSNICTNSGLMALAATVYLSLLGETGFRQLGEAIVGRAQYLAKGISTIPGFRLKYDKPFFKEFLVSTPVPASTIIEKLAKKDILAGIDVSRYGLDEGLLIAVTEKRTRGEMDAFIHSLREFSS